MNEKGPKYYPIDNQDKDAIAAELEETSLDISYSVGDKTITITFGFYRQIGTFIKKNDGNNLTGSTTQAYERAFAAMKLVANMTEKSWRYTFETRDPRLMKWAVASDSGQRIFNWDKEGFDNGRFVATKTIVPATS